jgi:hypothetical protein
MVQQWPTVFYSQFYAILAGFAAGESYFMAFDFGVGRCVKLSR